MHKSLMKIQNLQLIREVRKIICVLKILVIFSHQSKLTYLHQP